MAVICGERAEARTQDPVIKVTCSTALELRFGGQALMPLGPLLDPETLRAHATGNRDDRLMVLSVELCDDVYRRRDYRDLAMERAGRAGTVPVDVEAGEGGQLPLVGHRAAVHPEGGLRRSPADDKRVDVLANVLVSRPRRHLLRGCKAATQKYAQ